VSPKGAKTAGGNFKLVMKVTFQNPLPTTVILVCIGLSILYVACNPKEGLDNNLDSKTATMEEDVPAATWPVPLNAGKKWQMDSHTRNSIGRMKQLIEGVETATLGKSLAGEFHDLMKGCTMQGEPHNQLHVFLNEFMPGILALSGEMNDEEFKAERNRARKLLQEYDLYFE